MCKLVQVAAMVLISASAEAGRSRSLSLASLDDQVATRAKPADINTAQTSATPAQPTAIKSAETVTTETPKFAAAGRDEDGADCRDHASSAAAERFGEASRLACGEGEPRQAQEHSDGNPHHQRVASPRDLLVRGASAAPGATHSFVMAGLERDARLARAFAQDVPAIHVFLKPHSMKVVDARA
jgi:hypothetical protein